MCTYRGHDIGNGCAEVCTEKGCRGEDERYREMPYMCMLCDHRLQIFGHMPSFL